MWNDEDPVTGTTLYAPTAHSKGYIALDSNSDKGYYLLHSIVSIFVDDLFISRNTQTLQAVALIIKSITGSGYTGRVHSACQPVGRN